MDLTTAQKRTVLAAYLGWTLDAFDFFLLTFVIKDIAKEFGVGVPEVAYALFLTLAMRFIGAFIFGRIGDKWGRKPALMLDIVCYSVIGGAAAFSPNLTVFLILRALFGVAMGGEWGLGSSLAMESIPPGARGLVSGVLQCGYPQRLPARLGRLRPALRPHIRRLHLRLAPLVPAQRPARLHHPVHPRRGAGIAGLRARAEDRAAGRPVGDDPVELGPGALFGGADDGVQPVQSRHPGPLPDLPTEAVEPRAGDGELDHHRRQSRRDRRRPVVRLGSEKIGRVNAITVAALIALPALPLWAFSTTPIMLAAGAFVMQIAVQGAWGVVPAHLNELSPGAVRATLPAFVYQAGNFLASYNGPFQAKLAEANGGNYAYALALVAEIVAVALVAIIRFSPEKRGETLHAH